MSDSHPRSRRIRILRDEVSRKIAAGEVIDRPFSIVRELLDNAIDAGAAAIDVHLESGGLGRIRVVDDGAGMTRSDLELCWQPHATSKIESEDDLLRVTSLGFRGEALSSIAVCSRMVVSSCTADGEPSRLEVLGGRRVGLDGSQGRKGTVVEVSELFFNYPARKKFLRSASAESAMCRGIFIDRAAAHPDVSFRLFAEGQLRISLPAAPPVERIGLAYSQLLDPRLLDESEQRGEGYAIRVVAGSPELRRRDRKLVQSFVNRRRVAEYSLIQAAEFGFSGYMPGGWYPVAFVFVEIDPALVDFNIHPAKKEVRFRNLPEVHRSVVAAVRKRLEPCAVVSPSVPRASAEPPMFPSGSEGRGREPHGDSTRWSGRAPAEFPLPSRPAQVALSEEAQRIRFLGQVFGVFLVFELPGRLLILDQHAAHERILFERFTARAPTLQELLFPVSFDVSAAEEERLLGSREELERMGVVLQSAGARSLEVTALAEDFKELPEERLVEMLRGVGGEEWQKSFWATAACRLAIKEGEVVDPVTARQLCAEALKLPVPRCPHGRPIWHELSEQDLARLVDRPVT